MARISSFPTDDNVQGSDKFLGTDTSGATKNYELNTVGDFLSGSNSIIVTGQIGSKFVTDDSNFSAGQWMLNDGGAGNGESMSTITQITIHKGMTESKDAVGYLAEIFDDQVQLLDMSNVNYFYKYTVTTIIDHPSIANAYLINLSGIGGASSAIITDLKNYAWSSLRADKTHVHSQGAASSTWNITHNLNKKPSVTVVNSSDEVVVGEIAYTNNNSLTINFSAGFSGKAYLN